MELRPYQTNAIEQVRACILTGAKKILLCAPTGAGKTVIFSDITRSAVKKGSRVLIVTHREQLLLQSCSSIERFGVESCTLTADEKTPPSGDVCIAMIETIKRRAKKEEYITFLR